MRLAELLRCSGTDNCAGCRYRREEQIEQDLFSVHCIAGEAAGVIEELYYANQSLRLYYDSISKLPDCNSCLKRDFCEFAPRLGEYCRINCFAYLGEPKEEGQ